MKNLSDLLTIEHPAFDNDTIFVTRPINEIYNLVRHILLVRETGCSFGALSGYGKTRALRMIAGLLRNQVGNLVIIEHTGWNHQVPSIRAFFKHFLSAVKHPDLRGETFDLRKKLVNRLVDLARVSRIPIVLLLIDEANALRLEDFRFLKDVYNDLDKEGIQLITVMMGQEPELSDLIDRLRDDQHFDLVSRFARRHRPFRAYSDFEDIVGILRQYDVATHPPDSMQTWTQYFLPHGWEAGFRMESQAHIVEEVALARMVINSDSLNLPARQFFTALKRFLMEESWLDAEGRVPGKKAWEEAFDFALLNESAADGMTESKRGRRKK